MEEANRVTAYLKVTAEFYDPDATPETVRACVEQDLEDAGYEVEVLQEHADDGRDYKAEFTSFVDLVTFHYFKRHRFIGTPSYSAAKAAFLGCVPEWRKEKIENAANVTYETPTVIFKEKEKWISVKDRLPPERDTIFAKFYGTKQWNPNMFQKSSDDVRVVVRFEDGTRMVSHDHTFDGKWRCEAEKAAYPKRTVTHWMENPEPPEEEV